MWGWIIKVTLISILLIFLLHYLYSFFKAILTSPKLKDLVNKPQAKYNTIYNSLKSAGDGGSQNLGEQEDIEENALRDTKSKTSNMKDELKKYLKDLNIGGGGGGGGGSSGSHSLTTHTTEHTNIINDHNSEVSVYAPSNVMSNVGANGISTRVNNIPNYMPSLSNNTDSNVQIDYGTPSMSSSYSCAYSPY
jgi:hypothetical protein